MVILLKTVKKSTIHERTYSSDEVCGGEPGPDPRAAANKEPVLLGVERRNLVDEVWVALLAMGRDREVVGHVARTRNVALFKVFPHPHVQVPVLLQGEQPARHLCVHALHRRARGASQGAHLWRIEQRGRRSLWFCVWWSPEAVEWIG